MVAAITILETNNLKLEKQKEKEKKKKKILKELNLDPPLNPQTVFINFTQNPKKRSFLTPAEKTGRIHQYARTHMGETAAKSKKPGLRTGGGGEIVEVQGGHIVRSIGRKDRHSKVCTAKGPRDRRVRLSAPTAIQFYDVQDRLGYDRPSKAVDWLIKKAKPAIDKLRELPSWNPTGSDTTAVKSVMTNVENVNFIDDDDCKDYDNDNDNDSRFLPTSFDSETFADTVTSLFPTVETPPPSSSSFEFHAFPPDLSSRTNSRNQDLRLSLQSLQEPRERDHRSQNENFLLSGMEPFGGFDAAPSVWSENTNQSAAERYRLNWNDNGGGGGEYSYNLELNSTLPLPLSSPVLQPLFGENQLFSQRGPLQSSNIPSFRAWIDPSIAYTDNQHHMIPPATYQPLFSGLGFAPGGFSRFLFPTRNSGEEEHDGISDKPSSASSNSRY